MRDLKNFTLRKKRFKSMENQKTNWTICQECQGQGTKKQRITKKAKLRFQKELSEYKKNNAGADPDRSLQKVRILCR